MSAADQRAYQEIWQTLACLQGDSPPPAHSLTRRTMAADLLGAPVEDPVLDERGRGLISIADHDPAVAAALDAHYETHCARRRCGRCALRNYCNTYVQGCQRQSEQAGLTIADFFCGAGGMSVGFVQEGFDVALATDIDAWCTETYAHNHPSVPRRHIVTSDLDELLLDLPHRLRYRDVDVVVGGPPCQGFSNANRQRLIDDPRNHLYKSFVEAVRIVQPRFLVMENVRGMLSIADQVAEDLSALGFDVSYRLIKAIAAGVPQTRERVIFVGNRLGLDSAGILDELEKGDDLSRPRALRQAIGDLPALEAATERREYGSPSGRSGSLISRGPAGWNEYVRTITPGARPMLIYNHEARYNNERDIEIFGLMEPNDYSDAPRIQHLMPYTRRAGIFRDKYYKLNYAQPCRTITAHMQYDCNMYIHPEQARGLTPREAARVQSFPDTYFFCGPFTRTYRQIGNAVPPLLSRKLARALRKHLPDYEIHNAVGERS